MNRRSFLAGLTAVGAALMVPVNWVRGRFSIYVGKRKIGEAHTLQEALDAVPNILHTEVVTIVLPAGEHELVKLPRSPGSITIKGETDGEVPPFDENDPAGWAKRVERTLKTTIK
jgi:pectin methylesterase-like acyl-CoA thioesterase